MLTCQTPIVCTARGWVIGLGLDILLATDFAVVAEDARLWAPFTTFAFTPDSGATWLIPRLVGVARAREMLMLGEKVSGADAASWGLVHRAVPADDLEPISTGARRSPGRRTDRGGRADQAVATARGSPPTSTATWPTKHGRWKSPAARRTSGSTGRRTRRSARLASRGDNRPTARSAPAEPRPTVRI